jgi:SAM-dependent methyltransferase
MSNKPPPALEAERARWERLARDPYYAVLNEDGFRLAQSIDATRRRFDESGEHDLGETLADIRRHLEPEFRPARALDFGCGVGRLTIPLARVCGQVTGVDISQRMLDEARANCEAQGVANVALETTEEYFGRAPADTPLLDFVHSYIVFQHIPPEAGMWMADALVSRLASGGIGALHFTHARRASRVRRAVHRLRRLVPGVNLLANVLQRRPIGEPLIPMHNYDLGALFTLLGDRGCSHVHARLTDHGGHLGVMLLFRRG